MRTSQPGAGRSVSSQAAAVGLARTMRSIDSKLDAAQRRADKLLAEIKAMNASACRSLATTSSGL